MKNEVKQEGYLFNLSLNPLYKYPKHARKSKPTRIWEFLTAKNLKGFGANKAEYQTKIRDNHLDKPLRQIHHVLQYTKNLRKKDIYAIFNATTLEPFFKNLLRDPEINEHRYKYHQYDFRTSEIARLMFEIVSDYLLEHPHFKNNDNVKDYYKKLRMEFEAMSQTLLLQEDQFESLSKDEEQKILDEIEKLSPAEDLIKTTEWNFERIKYNLQKHRERFIDAEILINGKKSNSPAKKSGNMDNTMKELKKIKLNAHENVIAYKIEYEKELEKRKKILELRFKLNQQKYKHVVPFACTINTLEEMKPATTTDFIKYFANKVLSAKSNDEIFSWMTPNQFNKFSRIAEQFLISSPSESKFDD